MNSCRAWIISFLILTIVVVNVVANSREDDSLSSVSSSDGNIVFSLTIDRFGSPRYTVRHGAETVVPDSRLGLQFETQAAFDRNLRLVGTAAGGRDDPFHGGR